MKVVLCLFWAASLSACGDDDRIPNDGGVDALDIAVDVGPREAVDFRVVTWNVQNFFDSSNDPDTCDGVRNCNDVPSASEVEQKMADLGRVLVAIDADFIALQEVENEPLLQRLVEGPLASLGYTEYGLIDNRFEFRGIDVAFISRVPVTNVVSHLGEDFDGPTGESQFFTRDALEVFVEPGGIPVELMVLHLLSMIEPINAVRRLGEAMQAKRIVDRRISVGDLQRIIVLGDLNDFPASDPLDALLDDEVLFDLSGRIPAADRWSFEFEGRQQLDYILTTSTLESEAAAIDFVHGPDVDVASDHQPLVANFRLTP